jgi:peroxiredoxin
MAAARAFGIAFQLDAKTVKRYKGFGIDLGEAAGHDHGQLPVPAIFIAGKDGVIDFQYVNPDYSVRISADLVLAAAKTFQGE